MSHTAMQLLIKDVRGQPQGPHLKWLADWEANGPSGWTYWNIYNMPRPRMNLFEQAVSDCARGPHGAVLGLYVETSDWGYIVGSGPRGIAARLLINPDSAKENSNGAWALDRLIVRAGTEAWDILAAEELAAWSEVAPRRASADGVLGVIRQDWVFPEDGVKALRQLVGLPPPPIHPVGS